MHVVLGQIHIVESYLHYNKTLSQTNESSNSLKNRHIAIDTVIVCSYANITCAEIVVGLVN